jgi:hypothetical protein
MPVAVAITDQWSDGKRLHVTGTFTPSGNYALNGVAVNFGTAGVRASRIPKYVNVVGAAGYELVYVPGTNAQDGKLSGYSTGATQLTDAAAWPAGLTGVAIPFYAIFEQFI